MNRQYAKIQKYRYINQMKFKNCSIHYEHAYERLAIF